ncbi:MAG: hypothetical protein H6978_06640 [Gammaproteobacteria bacterium]|nr:hypothetical protein [Gammaproteobacteria bacterium]
MNFRNVTRFVLLAVTIALGNGCVTQQEVKSIVDASNAALAERLVQDQGTLLLAQTEPVTADSVDAGSAGGSIDIQRQAAAQRDAAVARIDAFIAANAQYPNLARTVNALQLRKALLLLTGGKPNMARAAFAQFKVDDAGNARDLGLYRSHEALTWWWSAAGRSDWDAASAARHLTTLSQAITNAPSGSGIRYYLATLRAHIRLKGATFTGDWRAPLREGLVEYSREFDAAARDKVRAFMVDPARLAGEPLDNLRWYGQAAVTFNAYDAAYRRYLNDAAEAGESTGEDAPAWPADTAWLAGLPAMTTD